MDPLPATERSTCSSLSCARPGACSPKKRLRSWPRPRDDEVELRSLAARRVAGEPLEHIVGSVIFGPLRLAVGPGAFVPRQRSLLVARLAADQAQSLDRPTVLELCCGVAPLAAFVAAAHHDADVIAADVNEAVLVFARANVPAGSVYAGSLFAALPTELRGTIDVVAAVPPYVPDNALGEMPREAREHEPIDTLLGGPDGLNVVRAILDEAAPWLSPSGVVMLELNVRQADPAIAYSNRCGLRASAVLHDDGQTAVLRATLG